ncbi:MAG TPA: hypothetical protein VF167_02930 [Longimicrobiaceae bacterium]
MASIGEQILDAIEAALDGAGKPSGCTVHSDPTQAYEGSSSLSEIVVDPVREQVRADDFAGSSGQFNVQRTMTVQVLLRAQGTPPRKAVDPLRVWVIQAMMNDPTWGGKATDTREVSTEWAASRAEAVYADAAVTFEIVYNTAGDDPETQE